MFISQINCTHILMLFELFSYSFGHFFFENLFISLFIVFDIFSINFYKAIYIEIVMRYLQDLKKKVHIKRNKERMKVMITNKNCLVSSNYLFKFSFNFSLFFFTKSFKLSFTKMFLNSNKLKPKKKT